VLMPQTHCSVPIGRLKIGSLRVRITGDDSLFHPHPPRFSVDPSDTFSGKSDKFAKSEPLQKVALAGCTSDSLLFDHLLS